MSQFLETIQLCDGVFKLVDRHQDRMNKALKFNYSTETKIDLFNELLQTNYPTQGLYKCRIIYSNIIELVEFVPYTSPKICSLKVVEIDLPQWQYKCVDRTDLQNTAALKGSCDDVLMVKNGLLTDTSFCNIAVYDDQNWFTPRLPILYGVQREQLIAENKIIEKDILLADINDYSTMCLFNAMNEFGSICVNVSDIVF